MAKTKTSTEVKNRWNANNYKRYTLSLRLGTDNDVINYLEKVKRENDNKGISEEIKEALREQIKKG